MRQSPKCDGFYGNNNRSVSWFFIYLSFKLNFMIPHGWLSTTTTTTVPISVSFKHDSRNTPKKCKTYGEPTGNCLNVRIIAGQFADEASLITESLCSNLRSVDYNPVNSSYLTFFNFKLAPWQARFVDKEMLDQTDSANPNAQKNTCFDLFLDRHLLLSSNNIGTSLRMDKKQNEYDIHYFPFQTIKCAFLYKWWFYVTMNGGYQLLLE